MNTPARGPATELASLGVTGAQAHELAVRTGLSPAERLRLLALPYPVPDQRLWDALADVGLTQESLMERLGAGP